jgi:hypothetical protein
MDTQHHTVTTSNTASSLSPLNTYLVSVQQEVLSTHQHTTRPVSATRHGYEHVGSVVHWVTPLAQDVVEPEIELVVCEVLLSGCCGITTGVLCVSGGGWVREQKVAARRKRYPTPTNLSAVCITTLLSHHMGH